MYEIVEWRRVSKTTKIYRERRKRIFSELLLLHSVFTSLATGLFKTFDPLRFFVFLSWHWYRADWKHLIFSAFKCFSTLAPSQGTSFSLFRDHTRFCECISSRFTTFMNLFLHISLLCVSNMIAIHLILLAPNFSWSRTAQAFLYLSNLAPWHKYSAQSCLTLLPAPFALWVENLQWLYNFPDAHPILVVIDLAMKS